MRESAGFLKVMVFMEEEFFVFTLIIGMLLRYHKKCGHIVNVFLLLGHYFHNIFFKKSLYTFTTFTVLM